MFTEPVVVFTFVVLEHRKRDATQQRAPDSLKALLWPRRLTALQWTTRPRLLQNLPNQPAVSLNEMQRGECLAF